MSLHIMSFNDIIMMEIVYFDILFANWYIFLKIFHKYV